MRDEANIAALEDRLATIMQLIEGVEPGSDEHAALKDEAEMICRILNDQEKLDQAKTQMTYQSLKDEADQKDRAIDRWIRTGLDILKVAVPSAVGFITFKLALAFETGGTFRAKAGLEALKRAMTGNRL